jgi:adenosylmethionine-8-amino-7-oxononanoate aminotransferase
VTSALLHPFASPSRRDFVRIVRGKGAVIWDSDGRELIDGMASLWYSAIGHGRPEMAAAVAEQITAIEAYSCFDPFTNDPAERLADELREIGPLPDARVFFTSSGSESIDTAMKLARLAHVQRGETHRSLIVSRVRGYHGTAYGGTSAQGIAPNREHFGPFVDAVVQVPADDIEALSVLFSERGDEVAAVIVEVVQGAGGVHPAQEGYIQAVRAMCDRAGAFLIFDEVITGFGRLGSWFGAHHVGVTPDMATFAKGVTSGYVPLGGVFVGPAVSSALAIDPSFFLRHGFTYSGHPTACAAGLKNLEIIRREGLVERAKHIGQRLGQGLSALRADGIVSQVRGVGGMWAAGLGDRPAMAVRDRMLDDHHVVVRALPDSLIFCPPLVITDEQIDRLIDATASALR